MQARRFERDPSAPGFYVVNRQSKLVSGPYASKSEAQRVADEKNAIEPATPGLLVVEEVRGA